MRVCADFRPRTYNAESCMCLFIRDLIEVAEHAFQKKLNIVLTGEVTNDVSKMGLNCSKAALSFGFTPTMTLTIALNNLKMKPIIYNTLLFR
jgi:hypothetical protein